MSTTPRTDAARLPINSHTLKHEVVSVDFARQLERELAAKEQELAEARKDRDSWVDAHDNMSAACKLYRTDLDAFSKQLTARDATIGGLMEAHLKARAALKHLNSILWEKDHAGIDIEIGSTALKSLIRWGREADDVLAIAERSKPLPSAVPVHPDTARLEERELQIGERIRKGDIGRWPDGAEIEVPAHFIGEKVRKAGIFFRPTDDAARQSTGDKLKP